MPDFLAALLAPYRGGDVGIPTSLADISGFEIGGLSALAAREVGALPAAGNIIEGDLTPANLATRKGVTLQRPALRSLTQLRRQLGLPIFANITSDYRTQAQQAALYQQKPGLAAPPGKSLHQQGLAIDVNTGWLAQHPEVRNWLRQSGWFQFDASKEPWHFSYGRTG